MRKVIETLLSSTLNRADLTENFSLHKPSTPVIGLIGLISFTLMQVLLLCFGKYLWNNTLVKLVPSVQAASSIWQILGLSILIKLIVN